MKAHCVAIKQKDNQLLVIGILRLKLILKLKKLIILFCLSKIFEMRKINEINRSLGIDVYNDI